MAYNTPTQQSGSTGGSSQTISPSSNVGQPKSNYVTPRIYRGFSSNNPNAQNGVLYDIDIIKQDIYNHFMTAKGERVMLPNFGSIVWDYLYEPIDEATKEVIQEDAKNIVSQDPRVKLRSIVVTGIENGILVNLELEFLQYNAVQDMAISFGVNSRGGAGGSGGY